MLITSNSALNGQVGIAFTVNDSTLELEQVTVWNRSGRNAVAEIRIPNDPNNASAGFQRVELVTIQSSQQDVLRNLPNNTYFMISQDGELSFPFQISLSVP